MKHSNFSLEYSLLERGSRYIAGMDEVGRGCLAGPVVAVIVVISSDKQYIPGVLDSKLMTPSKRVKMYKKIIDVSDAVGIGQCPHDEIDKIGIVKATELAMELAYQNLTHMPEVVLIDGKNIKFYQCSSYKIKAGDRKHYVISAASVVAKVYRDRLMHGHAEKYKGYGFETNVGYGTLQHRDAISRIGICPIHRRSFSPIRQIVGFENER